MANTGSMLRLMRRFEGGMLAVHAGVEVTHQDALSGESLCPQLRDVETLEAPRIFLGELCGSDRTGRMCCKSGAGYAAAMPGWLLIRLSPPASA